MNEKLTKINKNQKKYVLVFTKKFTFNEKRFSCDDCLGLLFFVTRPPTCGGCFTLQSTWHTARETAIRTVRLLHVCDKNIDFIDGCCFFCWRGRRGVPTSRAPDLGGSKSMRVPIGNLHRRSKVATMSTADQTTKQRRTPHYVANCSGNKYNNVPLSPESFESVDPETLTHHGGLLTTF